MSILARLAPPPAERGYEARHPQSPIVKWAGGKTRLLPELLARMPRDILRYYEPFAGGAALFFAVTPHAAVLNDANADLIATYTTVRDNVEDVIMRLTSYAKAHRDHFYALVRDNWNGHRMNWSVSERAAAFIYLNKTCFNGLWRVNSKGEFNVPMGDYKNPTICNEVALRAASAALQNVALQAGGYAVAVTRANPGDFVYFDPPYDPVSKTSSFTAYASGGFTDDDQRTLAKVFTYLASRRVRVMLSNSDTPFVRALYAGHKIDSVSCGRSINANGGKRGKVGEVIVTAGY